MKYSLIALGAFAFFLAACSSSDSGSGKKLVIMSSGKFQVDSKDDKIISFEPGNQHNEKEINYSGDKVTVTVKSSQGDKTFELTENGTYLLNLKVDTLIGSVVNFGTSGMPTSISTQQLEHIIDSTQQLMMGMNPSDADKTYFLAPNNVHRISAITTARLIGPYNAIPYSVESGPDGKAPEIYKFFTNKQKRESLIELIQRLNK
ncbi:MAG: hypothetical protein P0Y53_04030 [Candidatus Pseudobacter hemicellulosilyticus]|uniref:DUF4369 domain-containing protein n=1 Tax=Candidatus Pseudobacter hemicellulosilyticus TaxID=3121375 RepID=A0AAJ5WTB9_9BACT|nr:MAG: hypothetical protein P0Y53_04030 [Pseudobacter sp.]